MAEQLPEPPSFELADLDAATGELATQARIAAVVAAKSVADTKPVAEVTTTADIETESTNEPTGETHTVAAEAVAAEPGGDRTCPVPILHERRGSFRRRIGARHEARPLDDTDFAAAEAEASRSDDGSDAIGEEIPIIADEVIAARLAGLVPDEGPRPHPRDRPASSSAAS